MIYRTGCKCFDLYFNDNTIIEIQIMLDVKKSLYMCTSVYYSFIIAEINK